VREREREGGYIIVKRGKLKNNQRKKTFLFLKSFGELIRISLSRNKNEKTKTRKNCQRIFQKEFNKMAVTK
jgi:hypothetical protein